MTALPSTSVSRMPEGRLRERGWGLVRTVVAATVAPFCAHRPILRMMSAISSSRVQFSPTITGLVLGPSDCPGSLRSTLTTSPTGQIQLSGFFVPAGVVSLSRGGSGHRQSPAEGRCGKEYATQVQGT